MPGSIYNSLYTTFVRQGFTKSISSGYAQSVVAATHPHTLNPQNRPSFARRHSSGRLGRLQAYKQLQSAFHTSSASNSAAVAHELRHERTGSHGGLDAYFESLKKKDANGEVTEEEEEGSRWVQFQFQKRLEWNPSPGSVLTQDKNGHELSNYGVQGVDASQEAEAALAHVDQALEKAIAARQRLEVLEEEPATSRPATPQLTAKVTRTATPVQRPQSPPRLGTPSVTSIVIDPQSRVYAEHLTKLAEHGRYAEIPAVFEAMLVAGVQPTAVSYNALLMAAIHLPTDKIEVVSKALDVYADMMRRKVLPDNETFNILVGLLASRSNEVHSLKNGLEEQRVRFGGMEEPGKFMFASHELEHAILSEDDRLDLAISLFKSSIAAGKDHYGAKTYLELISACAQAGRVHEMLELFEHQESHQVTPYAATFPAMIDAFANSSNLISAVECYNEYRSLAIAHNGGNAVLQDRQDAQVYAAVVKAYIISGKLAGASRFVQKIVDEYGVQASDIQDAITQLGYVKALTQQGKASEALPWAQSMQSEDARAKTLAGIAVSAADAGDAQTAVTAFGGIPSTQAHIIAPAIALLALSVRQGNAVGATRYWQCLSSPSVAADASFIEPTAMFAVALIGSGQVAEALNASEMMFERIRAGKPNDAALGLEIDEGTEFITRYMAARGIIDPRLATPAPSAQLDTFSASPYQSSATVSSFEDTFDPYAHSTDFKGSTLIADDLEGNFGRRGPKLNDALARFRNIRRAGRHPRYTTYAKLITAAARENKFDLCQEVLSMARADVPMMPQYAVVRYGWSSILDSMVGACLTQGYRPQAEQYHRELTEMGSAPSANTFGLYITTLKESAKTFDEASEAVKIFHRARAEGVEPSSFLYNALIGKLGKARRIDDCLFHFAEMRALGIKPTSVTYGTIVNALCRVSDDKFAEELFDEMEAMPNYKARPAPYNSMMQFFLTTKRDKSKVLSYFERMRAKGIAPTAHTNKLLIDTYATLEPVDMQAAEAVLDSMRVAGQQPEPVHYASLIHARGCVLHDMAGARAVFDSVLANPSVNVNASLFQALFEAMVANHCVVDTEPLLAEMRRKRVELTPYIANTLIHGWAAEKNIARAEDIYGALGRERREPSTYEAMTRAYLAVEEREKAKGVVSEMLGRGYPSAVANKVLELLGGGAETVL